MCTVLAMSLQVKCGGLQATAGVALTSQSTVNKLLAVTCSNRKGLYVWAGLALRTCAPDTK